jgi:hypothetical protein
MTTAVRVKALLSFVLVLACKVTDVGEPSGVFPCETADECPDGQACVVGKCFSGDAPTVEIVTPEDEQAFPYIAGTDTIDVMIKIGGSNLELVDAASDPDNEFGRGQIVVFVDGEERAELDFGSLASGVDLVTTLSNRPGPHRVSAQARFSNGQVYDNPEASGSRLFWLDDGNPWVGFKSPVPNQRFSFEEIEIDVTIAVLNFLIVPAVGASQPGVGHAHLLFNKPFPDCEFEGACRQDYIEVLAPLPPSEPLTSVSVPSGIPSSAAGADSTLTAAISQTNHDSFLNAAGQPVFETIPIVRVAEPAPEPDAEDEG